MNVMGFYFLQLQHIRISISFINQHVSGKTLTFHYCKFNVICIGLFEKTYEVLNILTFLTNYANLSLVRPMVLSVVRRSYYFRFFVRSWHSATAPLWALSYLFLLSFTNLL